MYQAIVFLPLLGFLIAGLFGPLFAPRFSEVVTTSLLFVSLVLSFVAFADVGFGGQTAFVPIANWFTSGALKVDWAFRIDTLTVVMLVVVTFVSAFVHLYSIGYMREDAGRPRFFAYLSLFTFAMLMLVTADNLVQLFFGWEGVGLASYLLIGFWYHRPSANAAAIKAFIVNRVGDFGFSLGIFLVFALTNSVSYDTIFAAAPGLANKTMHVFGLSVDAMTMACLLLFMGAMGKSAQFLLHTWLPDAMEGPTPVSALIHAATMVTAGVFMVARLSPLFEQAPAALSVVIVVGGTTAFFAATVGLVQNDIKRVVAYSTCSQLGYMFVGLGVGGYGLGIFHLFTHAFFKALLFLGAGSVITAMHHEQDMRKMGGLRKQIPFTFWMMVIGTLSLTGFPFTAGYFSKDAIIEAAYASQRPGAAYGFLCVIVAAALTSFYSWRLVFLTFFDAPHVAGAHDIETQPAEEHDETVHHEPGDHHGEGTHGHGSHEVRESPLVMLIPLAVLAVGAIGAGFAFRHWFVGEGFADFWKGALFSAPTNHIREEMEKVPGLVSLLPSVMMIVGFLVALHMYILQPFAA
ncbi:MAG: NADH-quinone oxidoreductase subunit L, partial [Methylobacteriaceae bacterium]|nr:NADH-quinone oxidoreductase subunit L [Methylobacteriaceae bacterium]